MMTAEECYEYVLRRCGELSAQRKRRRVAALKIVPVCGIVLIAGLGWTFNRMKDHLLYHSSYFTNAPGCGNNAGDWEQSSVSAAQNGESNAASGSENTPKYENKLNIGEVEIATGVTHNLYLIPALYEMTRDEVLEHFGLSTELDLSEVVDGLRETAPKNGVLNSGGKHGFCRGCITEENGIRVEHWEELNQRFEHDEFVFESEDGTKSATVIFDHDERVDWLRCGILTYVKDESHYSGGYYSTEPFYALPASEIAGVEMRVAKRSTGGYYAEFVTKTAVIEPLAVGLGTSGLSEEETVSILEYLAEYVGAAAPTAGNRISADELEVSYPDMIH